MVVIIIAIVVVRIAVHKLKQIKMGWNRRTVEHKDNEVDVVYICSVHERFQSTSGQWIPAGVGNENMDLHLKHTKRLNCDLVDSVCDECNDVKTD